MTPAERLRAVDTPDALVAVAPVLMWTSDPALQRTWFNERWSQFVGRTPEAGAGWMQHVHRGDLETLQQVTVSAAAAGQPFSVEYRMQRHDGVMRWMLDRGTPVHDDSGTVTGYVGCVTDVTPIRNAETTLQESRDMLSLVMRGGRIGAWSRILPDGDVWWSPELEDLFGLPRGDFCGTCAGVLERVHEEDHARLREAVDRAIADGSEFLTEFRFRHASGEWRWMEARGRATYDPAGRPRMLHGVGVDVTERRIAERDHAYLASIIASSTDAVISKSLDGIITSWNTSAERMFGYTAEEAVGQPVTLIIPPEHQDEERRILERLRRGERIDHFETVRVTRSGARLHVSLTISPVRDARGRVIGASKIARDITDMKDQQRERDDLLARERAARAAAEDASRLKDDFLATVSHEVRTPLNAILGWARLLRDGHLDETKAAYAAEVIERNSRLQAKIIEDLLDVSSIVRGKLRLKLEAVPPAEVVAAAAESVRPDAAARGIQLETAMAPDAGTIVADAGRLQQVVWNLLSNAIKFTPAGGRVDVALVRNGAEVEIVVRDTGQGIAPDFLPQVFERFRQGDASSTRRTGGLGLGLAIVRHIVELHGGAVRAESAGLGRGATFTVRLPVVATPMPAVPVIRPGTDGDRPLLEEAPSLDGVAVLVVDDEATSRELIREILEQRGATVIEAVSVAEALEQLDQRRPNLIVSDIAMPGEDGYALIRAVRARSNGVDIPAVALTAYARSEDRRRALAAGYQIHVPKPIDPIELVLVVASLVTRSEPA